MNLLAIDYGLARIGLAKASSPLYVALPLSPILCKKSMNDQIRAIVEEVATIGPFDKIVIGLPLLLNGQDSSMTVKVREFAQKLEEKISLPVELWDERLTSTQVDRLLKEASLKRKKRNHSCDSLSACVLLQSYIDAKNSSL